jgi:hypothetical protein
MEITARKLFVTAALLTLVVSPAAAGHPLAIGQHWGRWIGYGWSEGYHARDEVPPRRGHSQSPPQLVTYGPAMMPPPPRNVVEVLPAPLPPPERILELGEPR